VACGLHGPAAERAIEDGWAERERIGKGLGILVLGLKGIQTMEFKLEFEFQQTKEMHQHECHN
jgi:hypothetical protein